MKKYLIINFKIQNNRTRHAKEHQQDFFPVGVQALVCSSSPFNIVQENSQAEVYLPMVAPKATRACTPTNAFSSYLLAERS
jgi:hypothetical protein